MTDLIRALRIICNENGPSECGEAADSIERLEARLAEAERKIADALATAGGRWCEWGSRAESVRDILQRPADSAPAVPPAWKCTVCGNGNVSGVAYCTRCEYSRHVCRSGKSVLRDGIHGALGSAAATHTNRDGEA